jgi:hypothetical protein
MLITPTKGKYPYSYKTISVFLLSGYIYFVCKSCYEEEQKYEAVAVIKSNIHL